MREIRTSSSMSGRRKRTTAQRAGALLLQQPLIRVLESTPDGVLVTRSWHMPWLLGRLQTYSLLVILP